MKKFILSLFISCSSAILLGQTGEISAMISPNPARQFCEVSTSVPVVVRVYDMQGKTLLEEPEATQFDLDLREVPEGIYFLHLIGEHRVQTFRLVRTYDRT